MPLSQADNPILTRPRLSRLSLLRRPLGGALPPALEGARLAFYAKGRNAIWHAVNALGLSPDRNVLMPAYLCGSELDAVLKAGVEVRFYRIDTACRIDEEHLRRSLDARTGAVFVIHYFGFPQESLPSVASLCRERGIYLLEDCAHALYSKTQEGQWVGGVGDLSIFSLWKDLPIPDGGATRINHPALTVRPGTVDRPLAERLRRVRYGIRALAAKRGGAFGRAVNRFGLDPVATAMKRAMGKPPSALPQVQGTSGEEPPNPHVTLDLTTVDLRMSRWSGYVLRRIDHQQVIATRRENFRCLAGALEGLSRIHLIHSALPEGACPLCLPVLTEDAPALHRHLLERQIVTDLFWHEFHPCSPGAEFPEARALKTQLVGLPVHQDIEAPGLRRMVEAVSEWSRL